MEAFYLAGLPLVGAAIGWLTNRVAVILIFRPHRPVNLMGYAIQGVVPKRRSDLARIIGQVVERELISVNDLAGAVGSAEVMDRIEAAVAVSIRDRIMDRLPAFLPAAVRRTVSDLATDRIRSEIRAVTTDLIDRIGALIKEKVDFRSIVEERVNSFSPERLEQIVLSVSARELRHIEVIGGVLGFAIGLIQSVLVYAAVYR